MTSYLLALTSCVNYLKSSERWVPGPLSPQTSMRRQTFITSSSSSHPFPTLVFFLVLLRELIR